MLNVRRLAMVETGTYNDMWRRPYTSTVDNYTMPQLTEVTNNGQDISAQRLATVASSIIRPSASAESQILIPNGWGQTRFRFYLEIEHQTHAAGCIVQYLTGYTDHPEISHSGLLDPNMRLFFNSNVTVKEIVEMTPMGAQTRVVPVDASQILRGDYSGAVGRNDYSMRPEDIYHQMNSTAWAGDDQNVDIYDGRIMFSNGIRKSARNNGVASNFLHKLMLANRAALANVDAASDPMDFTGSAAGSIQEATISGDMTLSAMMRETGLVETGSITYADLCRMAPMTDNVCTVSLNRNLTRHSTPVNYAGDSEHWAGSNQETVLATMLVQAVPALLMDLLLTDVTFYATNGRTGQMEVTVTDGHSLIFGMDPVPALENFRIRLFTDVLAGMTLNNHITLTINQSADFRGDTTLDISINGYPAVPFSTASFADALNTSLITSSADTVRALASDVGVMNDQMNRFYAN